MLVRKGELACRLSVEHVFKCATALEGMVLETIGRIAHQTEFTAKLVGGAKPKLHPVTLKLIEAV